MALTVIGAVACDQGARQEPPAAAKHETRGAVGGIKGTATWAGENMYGHHEGVVGAGTDVVLLTGDGKVVQTVKTTEGGAFEFKNVPVGTYTVELHQQNDYSQHASAQIEVHANTIEQATLQQAVALPYGAPPARRRVV